MKGDRKTVVKTTSLKVPESVRIQQERLFILKEVLPQTDFHTFCLMETFLRCHRACDHTELLGF